MSDRKTKIDNLFREIDGSAVVDMQIFLHALWTYKSNLDKTPRDVLMKLSDHDFDNLKEEFYWNTR